jgi:hypothetical protein
MEIDSGSSIRFIEKTCEISSVGITMMRKAAKKLIKQSRSEEARIMSGDI